MVNYEEVTHYLDFKGLENLDTREGTKDFIKFFPDLEKCCEYGSGTYQNVNLTRLFCATMQDENSRLQMATLPLLEKLLPYVLGHKTAVQTKSYSDLWGLSNVFGNPKYILPEETYRIVVEKIADECGKQSAADPDFGSEVFSSLVHGIAAYNLLEMQKKGIGSDFPFKPKALNQFHSTMCTMTGYPCDGLVNAFASAANPADFVQKGFQQFKEGHIFAVDQKEYLVYLAFILLLQKQAMTEQADEMAEELLTFLQKNRVCKDASCFSEVGGFYAVLEKMQDVLAEEPDCYPGPCDGFLMEIAYAEKKWSDRIALGKQFGIEFDRT